MTAIVPILRNPTENHFMSNSANLQQQLEQTSQRSRTRFHQAFRDGFTLLFTTLAVWSTRLSNLHLGHVRRLALVVTTFTCSFVFAQDAFRTTELTMAWDEDPANQASQLRDLNAQIQSTLNTNPADFCFAIKTAPADILNFPAQNCTIGDSTIHNGYTNSLGSFELVLGETVFDYDSRVRHNLALTAHRRDTTRSGRTPNALRVAFDLAAHDEAPVLRDGPFSITRYLETNDVVQSNIPTMYRDPEGMPVTIDKSAVRVCESTSVGVTGPGTANSCLTASTGQIQGTVLTTVIHGPTFQVTANGSGLSAAGVYYAEVSFRATDNTSLDQAESAHLTVYVKHGANNKPKFAGGATGFSVSVNEIPADAGSPALITPVPSNAWNATDLDEAGRGGAAHGDKLMYSLVGTVPRCLDSINNAVQIGQMCVAVVKSKGNVALEGYFLDYESAQLSPSKSFEVTLRASDGWDHTDISITVQLNNLNELYMHRDPRTESVLPSTIRLIEGKSVSLDLNTFFTDPEMDPITYYAQPSRNQDLTELSGSRLTINGTGTTASNPTIRDTVLVTASDGTLSVQGTVNVEVRNTNTPPRFAPEGVLAVAGAINENVPLGTAVDRLVQYVDNDSTGEELSVALTSDYFDALVDPLLENGRLCEAVSASCVRQTGRIALVSKASLNYEDIDHHTVQIGLHDGWVRSNPRNDVTVQVSVNDVNDPPVAVGNIPDQSVSVHRTTRLLAGDYFKDEDVGDLVIVSAMSQNPSIASVAVVGASEVTVTGVAAGRTRIELVGKDNGDLSATQFFEVTVEANRSPVAQPDAFAAALPVNQQMLLNSTFDVPLVGLFADPDDDSISVAVETSDDNIVLVTPLRDGSAVVLVARAVGQTTLKFIATDSATNVTEEVRTIEVVSELTGTNEAPVIDRNALARALPKNNTIIKGLSHDMSLPGLFTDPDGDALEVNVDSSNENFVTVALSTDGHVATLAAIAIGNAVVTFTATDTSDNRTSVPVTISVVAEGTVENQPPVLDRAVFTQALPPDNRIVRRRFFRMNLKGLFTDPDSDEVRLAIASSAESVLGVRLNTTGTSALLVARAVGSAELTFTAADAAGNRTAERTTIEVVISTNPSTNRPPELDRDALTAALPPANTIPEGEFFELELDQLFSDPDPGDRIATFEAATSDADVLFVDLDASNLLAAALAPGMATLTIVARDTFGSETTVKETITITAATTSSLVITSQTLDRSAPLTLDLRAAVPVVLAQNAKLTLESAVGDASILSTAANASRLTITALNQGRTYVKLKVVGANGYAAKTVFFVDVVNAPPMLETAIPDQTTTRVDGLTIDIGDAFVDADGEALTLTAQAGDDDIIDIILDGSLLSITGLQVGETTITLIAMDASGLMTSTSFKIAVENVGPIIAASLGPFRLEVGGEAVEQSIAGLFVDDGDTLTYTMQLDRANIVDASLIKTVAQFSPLSRGNVSFIVTATDAFGAEATITGEITVSDEKLKEIAAKSLTGFGRALISSVSSSIGERLNADTRDADLSRFSWQPAAHDEFATSSKVGSIQIDADWNATEGGNPGATTLRTGGQHMNLGKGSGFESMLGRGFAFNLGSNDEQATWFVWSHSDRQSVQADAYDGSTSNIFLGIDTQLTDAWLLGLSLSDHRGEFDYAWGTASQHMNIDLRQVMPYTRYSPASGTSLWGTVGFGVGELDTTVVGAANDASRVTSRLAMLGGRHSVATIGRFDLAVRGDLAASVLSTSAGNSASDGLVANVHRGRTGIEGLYTIDLSHQASMTPFGQINFRTDGGDGDAGSGIEITSGVRLATHTWSVEVVGRSFSLQDQNAYVERGLTMTATLKPSSNGTGFAATISPRWGANVTTSAAMWNGLFDPRQSQSHHRQSPLTQEDAATMQLDADFGYGLLVVQERLLLTPFVNLGFNEYQGRQLQIGAQLRQVTIGDSDASLRLALGQLKDRDGRTSGTFGLMTQLNF